MSAGARRTRRGWPIPVAVLGKVDHSDDHIVGIVAKRGLVQTDQPPDGRAGSRQQQHRQRNLPREQEVMRSPAFDASGRPGRRRQARARQRQGRRQSTDQGRRHRQARTEEQDRHVDGHRQEVPNRHRIGGQEPEHGRQAPVARRNAQCGAAGMPGAAIPREAAASTVHDWPRWRPARRTRAPARCHAPAAGWTRSRRRAGAATSTTRRSTAASGHRLPSVGPSASVQTSGRASLGKRCGSSLANSSKSGCSRCSAMRGVTPRLRRA